MLDGSRIHNEAYEWARKMAVDALEYDEDENEGEGNPASAIEDILRYIVRASSGSVSDPYSFDTDPDPAF